MDLIQENPDGFTLSEVAEATGMPKSSAFRYLATLEERRYVQRTPTNGLYQIGPAFLPLQAHQLSVLADRARPYLRRLRDRFEETFNLGVLDGNRISYLEIVESPKTVRLAARPGDRDPLHCTALGKAVASILDAERVRAILQAEGMPARTSATITDPDVYLAELEEVRARGYAVDNGENEDDGRCVAVALPGLGLPASISLSAPASRFAMDRVSEAVEALKETAGLLVKEITGEPVEPQR